MEQTEVKIVGESKSGKAYRCQVAGRMEDFYLWKGHIIRREDNKGFADPVNISKAIKWLEEQKKENKNETDP